MGWRAVLLDVDTQLEPTGSQSLGEARSEALDYLESRLRGLNRHDPATRCAGLRMAVRRVQRQREIS